MNDLLTVGPSDISHCCSCRLKERFQNVHRSPGHHICHGPLSAGGSVTVLTGFPAYIMRKKNITQPIDCVISSSNLGPNVILNKNTKNIFQGIFLPFLPGKEK